MSFETGPETNPEVLDLEILKGLADLAERYERSAFETGSLLIERDPLLHSMLTQLIEAGPELDLDYLSHLKRMIVIRLAGLSEIIANAVEDSKYYMLAIEFVEDEIREIISSVGDLPDPWDSALRDLSQFDDRSE